MLESENIIDEFKKTLTATIKSIGKSDNIEVNFVKDQPSINGQIINLCEVDIKLLKNKLNYIRAEADSMALEFRFHKKKIHNEYLGENKIANEIFTAVEQSRIEAMGSQIFKGIKKNILNKHITDLTNYNSQDNKENEIIKAFRYVSYSELTFKKCEGKFLPYKKLIKKKLGKKYNNFFSKLKKNISNQEEFAKEFKLVLEELGFFEGGKNNEQKDTLDHEKKLDKEDSSNNENKKDDSENKIDNDSNIEASSQDSQQASSAENEEEIGDNSSENELDYFPNIKSLDKIKDYKSYTDEFDEIIKAEDLCDIKELDNLRNVN